jgi:hypothetical protein
MKQGDNLIGPNFARRDRFFSLDVRQSYRQQMSAVTILKLPPIVHQLLLKTADCVRPLARPMLKPTLSPFHSS